MLVICDNSALSALAEMGLTEAAIAGEVDFEEVLTRLLATGFRLSPVLMEEARASVKSGPLGCC